MEDTISPKYDWLSDIDDGWREHIPFAFTLVENIKPKIFVELGTYKGASYFAFSNAVLEYNVDCKCYAVDTWEGDGHVGFYGPEVFDLVSKYNEKFSFSKLLKMQFDEAKEYFADNEIDILHIDGFHTYDIVRHDFHNWLNKVKKNGIILLHDTQVKRDDFGVYKLWEELKEEYKYHYEFTNGNGLGVLFLEESQSPPQLWVKLQELNIQNTVL